MYKNKDCTYCADDFTPTGPRQNACHKIECQEQRKKDNQKNYNLKAKVYDSSRPEVRMKNLFLLGAA